MESIGDIIGVLIEGYSTGFCKADKDDYVGDDGLLHCHVCKEPKQRYYKGRLIGRQCKCERERVEKEIERRKKIDAENRVRALRGASLMNGILLDARFDKCSITSKNQRNFDICKGYVEKFEKMKQMNQGLLFWGPVGTGKSYAAACIANELINKGHTVVMTSIVRLLSLAEEEEFDAIMRRMMNCELVILDDLGAERNTDYALEKVYYVIESRHRSGEPMIVTTNLTLDEMRQIQDERYARTYDRILDVCYPMQWTGPSWRKVQAKEKFNAFESVLGIKQ